METQDTVLHFWFKETSPSDWFQKNETFDLLIKKRFTKVHQQAIAGELYHWRKDALGRLAEIIVIDQFSRNMFREDPRSWLYDPIALVLSQEAINIGIDQNLKAPHLAFLYMPFMHSESALIHEKAVDLFSKPGLENNLEYELMHKKIIDRFGRYPHRNQVLGRETTMEEAEFLEQPNSSF